MTKPKSFKIELGIYPFEILVSVGQNTEQLVASMKEHWDEPNMIKQVEDGDNCVLSLDTLATCTCFNCSVCVLRFRKSPEARVIVHEVFHAVYKIMERIGQELVDESQESYAYLMEFIFKKVQQGLKEK